MVWWGGPRQEGVDLANSRFGATNRAPLQECRPGAVGRGAAGHGGAGRGAGGGGHGGAGRDATGRSGAGSKPPASRWSSLHCLHSLSLSVCSIISRLHSFPLFAELVFSTPSLRRRVARRGAAWRGGNDDAARRSHFSCFWDELTKNGPYFWSMEHGNDGCTGPK